MLVVVVLVGLAVQPFRQLAWTDGVGTLAYGAAAVAVAALALPRRGALLPGAIGTGLACAVEILQLTGVPAALSERFPPAALLLGSSFDPVDVLLLIAGGVGAVLALSVPSRVAPASHADAA
ncbi:hypothetical protein GCM10027067_24980 [Pseudactinotalea suaedae]